MTMEEQMQAQYASQTENARDAVEIGTRMTDLAADTYTTWVNSLMWWQQRSLDLTKTYAAQTQTLRSESRGIVEDYNTKFVRGQQLWQEAWQEGVKSYMSNLDYLRYASDSTVSDLNRRIDQLQATLNSTYRAGQQ